MLAFYRLTWWFSCIPLLVDKSHLNKGKSINYFLQHRRYGIVISGNNQVLFLDLWQNNVEQYRRTVLSEIATFRVYINRLASDFANDVLEVYKKTIEKLCSPFSVKLENETSVGSGPVCEFFSILMNMIVDGFPLDGEDKAPTLIFEGESDHKIPVANSLLRRTGFYKLVGRMIAHSFIHKGPPIFGNITSHHRLYVGRI